MDGSKTHDVKKIKKRLRPEKKLLRAIGPTPTYLSSAKLRKAVMTFSYNFTFKLCLKCSSDWRGMSNFMSVISFTKSFMATEIVFQVTFWSPVNSAIAFWEHSWKATITFIMPMVLASGQKKS